MTRLWIRLAALTLAPGKRDDLRQAFHYSVAPMLALRQGLATSFLLEPEAETDPVLLYTSWQTRQALDEFLGIDDFHEVTDVLIPLLAGPISRTTYEAVQ